MIHHPGSFPLMTPPTSTSGFQNYHENKKDMETLVKGVAMGHV